MRTWLRQLDDDAYSGALWRRPLFYVPLYLLLGALPGIALGCFGAFALAFALPGERVIPGPDGAPMTVPYDYSGLPILGGVLGLGLGLFAGGFVAVRKWRGTG